MNLKGLNILKKNALSMLPIVVIVIGLCVFFQIDLKLMINFLGGSILIVLGVSFYLVGFDMSYPKIADRISHGLIKRKNIIYVLGMCFLMGTAISLVAKEILEACGGRISLLILLASSIGFFFMISIFRILTKTDFKVYLIISYIIIFMLMIKADMNMVPFALDRAALGTGAISAPFLLTIGMSFSRRSKKPKKNHTSFGILGLSAVGPIIIFLLISIYSNITISTRRLGVRESLLFIFLSLIPIFLLYLYFIKGDIKKHKKEIKGILTGFLFVFLGVGCYYTGAKYGYLNLASLIGEKLINVPIELVLIIGGVLGYLILRIEPSFVFLMNYVNDVTKGGIKEKFLELFLSLGVAFSFMMSLIIAINKVDILVVLLPSFFLAIILAFFTPNTFLSLAFDSLGAVIGTISSSFLLPILIGITNSSLQTFGYVAFIGIIPVIFLEIAGFIYEKEIILHDYNQLDDEVVIYD